MRVLITGSNGQLGSELVARYTARGDDVFGFDLPDIDITDPASVAAAFEVAAPEVVINCAAWTAVDAAEENEEGAHLVNGVGAEVLARACAASDAWMVQISTDYVFSGDATLPYREESAPNPRSAYGRTKLAGERAIAATRADWLILRTSWVYASRGSNFVRTMLRLGAEREALRVVADQIGAPTSARLIADVTAHLIKQSIADRLAGRFESGLFHLTARGQTSWHGFAAAIFDRWPTLSRQAALRVSRLEAIESRDYPTPAARPLNSRLDCQALETRFGLSLPDWQAGLEQVLTELAA
jgi:dTDP-4-dehydrorhamnose reductase